MFAQLRADVAKHKWYHRIDLPAGIVTPGWAPLSAERYGLPDDLTGKRVLDVGAWDGYWTFECLRRGAREVVAIDDFSDTCGEPVSFDRAQKWATFDLCKQALGYGDECKRMEVNAEQVSEALLGRFDVVLCFGLLYHCKHPGKVLEALSSVCDDLLLVENAILDDYSPYRGGIGNGYRGQQLVSEFYPYNEYGNNPSNWWVPTLQCLASQIEREGFKGIEVWKLTGDPEKLHECRGFVRASRKALPQPIALKCAAVMSVPRLGFMDNSFCVFEALPALNIPLIKTTGVFWGQCLERGMEQLAGGCDVILTIDYDTLFKKADVEALLRIMQDHPEIDAITPMQLGRGKKLPLITAGDGNDEVDMRAFNQDLVRMATAHFGLTMIRVSALKKMAHPWFIGQPGKDGRWGDDRIDDDITFWKNFQAVGNVLCLAPRVVVGHCELQCMWPDMNGTPIYQNTTDFFNVGKPEGVWR